MDTSKTVISAVLITLICLCFSGSALAYQQSHKSSLHSNYTIDSASLSSLYPQPSDYLWIDKLQLTDQAYQALEFIAGSANHGLNPDNYHFDLLQQLEPQLNESEAHLFDLMLTDGLLKLIHDMSVGRLDPDIADPKWSIPRAAFDATAFLQHALSSNNFKSSLNSLVPASNQYRQLIAAAARYHEFVDRGGWRKIPATPELRVGDVHHNVAAIRNRLLFENHKLSVPRPSKLNFYDRELEQAVQQFQRRHSLPADGIIGPATLRAMNISAAERLQQININLERLRWLPDDLGKRYIMVNLANYRLTAVEDDRVKLDMRVIVGKIRRATPSFSSQITHIVSNPRWYIPSKLARMDLLPKQQNNPNYFEHYNIRVFTIEEGKRTEIDPNSVDWHSVSKHHFPYSLVQDAGKKNALGRLKFVLPNRWRIYLHDTPSKSLFNKSRRMFSAGCIRVEDPFALADFILNSKAHQQKLLDIVSSNESYSTKLEQPLSVYAVYTTVWFQGNEIIFSPDSYHRDRKMAKYI